MAFDRLASGIIRHHKAIIAMWIVILICAVPMALKSGDVMKYDTTEMAGSDSESFKGSEIISDYFPGSSMDVSSMPILIIKYKDTNGLESAEKLVSELNQNASKFTDKNGKVKLDTSLTTGAFVTAYTSSGTPGILMVGVVYNPDFTTEGSDDYVKYYVEDDTQNLRDFIKGYASSYGVSTYLTGTPAINHDTETGATADVQRIDPFTILLILVLVGLFFRSFISSATPPITIGVAFVVVLALIYMLGSAIFDVFFITEMMLLVSMMGAGCDYCIFIIARYKEELKAGKDHEAALHESIKWAGESIAVSGVSVMIGFGTMSICTFSLVSTMGICLALGILVALLAALTLIPSILAIVGDKIFWPSTMANIKEKNLETKGWHAWFGRLGHNYFEHSSRFSIKHAKAITIVAILVSAPAAYIALTSETSYDMIGAMQNGDSGEGMDLIGEYADEGMLMPNYVVIQYNTDLATVVKDPTTNQTVLVWTDAWTNGIYDQLTQLAKDIKEKDGGDNGNIGSITVPFMWQKTREEAVAAGCTTATEVINYAYTKTSTSVAQVLNIAIPTMINAFQLQGMTEEQAQQYLVYQCDSLVDYQVNSNCGLVGGTYANASDGTGNVTYIKISVPTNDAAMAPRSMESITAMSDVVDAYKSSHSDVVTSTWVTGTAAVMYEVSEVISDEFNKIEILVVVLIIILLFVVMKSYTIPFRSVLTILMSICWTLALTHLVFVNLLGGEVMWLVPLILLVICLGLGMDYDILLTTRIKENVRSKGMSNDEAIHQAVLHTGSVITICGLIMGGAFGTLMLSSMEMLKEFGFALCFAILVDALVVRTYIVPAVMHLLGDWNWKGPKFMHKNDPVPVAAAAGGAGAVGDAVVTGFDDSEKSDVDGAVEPDVPGDEDVSDAEADASEEPVDVEEVSSDEAADAESDVSVASDEPTESIVDDETPSDIRSDAEDASAASEGPESEPVGEESSISNVEEEASDKPDEADGETEGSAEADESTTDDKVE